MPERLGSQSGRNDNAGYRCFPQLDLNALVPENKAPTHPLALWCAFACFVHRQRNTEEGPRRDHRVILILGQLFVVTQLINELGW